MQQIIGNKSVYVVDFDTMPELPITGLTENEVVYKRMVETDPDWEYSIAPITHAQALTNAIETEVITEPGKYGIYLVPGTTDYEVYRIIEE